MPTPANVKKPQDHAVKAEAVDGPIEVEHNGVGHPRSFPLKSMMSGTPSSSHWARSRFSRK